MRAAELLGPLDTPGLRVRLLPVRPEDVEVRPLPPALGRVWPGWAEAVTMPWGIWVRPEALAADPEALGRTIAHELVHSRQWSTHGVAGFLRSYLADYFRGRRAGLGHLGAYRAIRFEREAYDTVSRIV